MTAKPTQKSERSVRFESLDAMQPAPPISEAVRSLSDAEVDERARRDPDAGSIPPGFWDEAEIVTPATKEQVTLRLDPDVLGYFRGLGKGYQSRMNAVLKSYVQAQKKVG